jgi:hypothetical protein
LSSSRNLIGCYKVPSDRALTLVAIAWTAIDLHRPIAETSQLPEYSDRFPTATAPMIVPVQTQIQPATTRPSQSDMGSKVLQPEIVPALSGHRIVAQPTVDLGRDDSFDIKFELAKGLQNLMAWSRSRVDAGHLGAD